MKIGIDIGGSHVGVGLVDEDANIIIKREIDLIEEQKVDFKKIIVDKIVECINEIIQKSNIDIKQIKYIGIAFPASLRNGILGKSVNLGVNGYEIKEELQSKVEIPTYIKNDAKCAAICEKKYGSLKEYLNCVFLTIGTGIGGAAFIDATMLGTTQNDLFKIGHITIQKDGIECKCGKKGCFEKYASITALKREIIKNYSINKELTGKELYNFIIEKLQDEKMEKIINEYIENLSIGLSYYKDIFLKRLEDKLQDNHKAFRDNLPKILIAHYKNDAGIIGAANIV